MSAEVSDRKKSREAPLIGHREKRDVQNRIHQKVRCIVGVAIGAKTGRHLSGTGSRSTTWKREETNLPRMCIMSIYTIYDRKSVVL